MAKFKQFPPRPPLVARKRSGRVALIAMGVSVSALALTGCEEKVDALQYSSAEACIVGGELSEADCQAGFAAAQKDHAQVAPKYQSRQDCEAEHGAAACQQPAQQQQASSGGGLWMPLMIGYMMGRAMSGPVAAQPLYRSSSAGKVRTASGAKWDAKAGPVSVPKSAAARPSAGKVVSRSGFGRTGGRRSGGRSFGG